MQEGIVSHPVEVSVRSDYKDNRPLALLLLANNNKADVIVAFCIENGIYDIFEVNALLFRFDQPILG